MLVMGVIWTIVAAIPGIIDYLTMPMPGISTYHLVVGLVITAYYLGLAFLRRRRSEETTPRVLLPLSVLGVLLITVQGYLGGELVYRYHIGVLPTAVAGPTSGADGRSNTSDNGRQGSTLAAATSGTATSGPTTSGTPATGAATTGVVPPAPISPLSAGLSAASLALAQADFKAKCLSCHAIAGQGGGDVGPDLTHEGRTRSMLWISAQIKNPDVHTPGSGMPAFPDSSLSPARRDAIAAYLAALK
ncbi:MAG: DUF2231 domain-containing protein [Chloroflexi bacterium]|nr:DUF2231 domain-containing protein [Chloroflexota bacterium]